MELKNIGGNINFLENAIIHEKDIKEQYMKAYIHYIKTGIKHPLIKHI